MKRQYEMTSVQLNLFSRFTKREINILNLLHQVIYCKEWLNE